MSKSSLLLLPFILLYSLLPAQEHADSIRQLIQQAHIPGIELAYIKNAKLTEHYSLGVQSNETKTPINDSTIFSAASLSKTIFSYLVFGLVSEKKLDLDKPLYTYYIYKDVAHDPRSKLVTARMILSHTSGLPNWRGGDSLRFKLDPGVKYNYSGEGMVWLSRVVESITGKDIEAYTKEKIFIPFGMTHSSYVWQKVNGNNLAYPHNDIGQSTEKYYPEQANVAHSLQTTALDFSKFLLAVLKDKKFTTAFLKEPSVAVKDEISWGLGLGHQTTSDGVAFFQWGDNGSTKGLVIAYPKKKDALVYFANSEYGLSIADELTSMFFGKPQPLVKWLDYDDLHAPSNQTFFAALNGSVADAIKPYYLTDKNMIDTSKLKVDNLKYMANRFMQLREYDKALEFLNEAIKFDGKDEGITALLGEIYLRQGHVDEAIQFFEFAAKDNAKDGLYENLINKLKGVYPIAKENEKIISFQLDDYPDAKFVALAGSLNGWNDVKDPMRWENGKWVARIALAPGKYEYKFVVDGVWISDPKNGNVDTTNFNSRLIVP